MNDQKLKVLWARHSILDDGLQLPFRKSALNGVEFLGLCSGQRVSYLIQEGWLGREAVNVHPLPADQPRRNGEANDRDAFPGENSSR